MPSVSGLRALGVALPDVSDRSEPAPEGKWSQFFGALAQELDLIGVVRPELSRLDELIILARTFHPRISRWRARAGFNRALAMRTTAAVQRGLTAYGGSYDVILQLQTLCAPGFDRGGVPYAIYTDNTMALTHRMYPVWAGLSDSSAASWMSFERDVCRGAAAVFTTSEFARRSVVEDYGCSPQDVLAVGAGTNQLLDSLAGKDYTAPRALFVGIDFDRKGGSVLLEAWRSVRERLPEAELIIAGPKHAPKGDPRPGIRWVGRVDRDELAQLYRWASVFVMPSLFEPLGLVFLEAMGHGLPCIGTSCCAMPELIADGVTGRLVERNEPEPLAGALIELLSDPERTAAMGIAAHASVQETHRWRDVAARIVTHLGRVPSLGAFSAAVEGNSENATAS
jgi:glycosyltransferase involved in cell wall biosynthesis